MYSHYTPLDESLKRVSSVRSPLRLNKVYGQTRFLPLGKSVFGPCVNVISRKCVPSMETPEKTASEFQAYATLRIRQRQRHNNN